MVCLLSALAFHGLTDAIPTVVDLAVARGRHLPAIDYPPVEVHVFDADTFELGRQQVEVAPDETIPVPDRCTSCWRCCRHEPPTAT